MKPKHLFLGAALGALSVLPDFSVAQTATVAPSPLEIHGDSIRFKAQIKVPADRIFKKEGYYRIMPELGQVKFPEQHIPSSKLNNAAKNGISVEVQFSAPFEEDMIGNDLEIEHEYVYKEGSRNKEFDDMDDLAECCISTGRLFVFNSQYNLQKYEYTPAQSAPLKVVAQFNFPQDISKLDGKDYKPQVTTIGEYLKEYRDANITIQGYASPEGTVDRNKTLAQERAENVKTWLTKQLKDLGYSKYSRNTNMTVEITTEDWDGLMNRLKDSGLSAESQQKVAAAISSGKSAAEIEKEVVSIMGGMKQAEPYLKPLRRATVVVASPTAKRKGYSAVQVDSIMNKYNSSMLPESSLADVFSDEEYLAASQRTDAKSGKLSLLAAYYQTKPADFRLYSDLGAMTQVDGNTVDIAGGDDAIMAVGYNRDNYDLDSEVDFDEGKWKIKQKAKREDVDGMDYKSKFKVDFKDGEELVMKAYALNPENPVVQNNVAATYIANGQFKNAYPILEKSLMADDSQGANYNMGLYFARMGNYKKALEHFNKANDVKGITYNRALAKLMTGDTAGAQKDINVFTNQNPGHMLGHYVAAIVGARLNNMEMLTQHLKQAIVLSNNKNLADAAEEDLEFRKYWNDKAFKDASDDDAK